MRLVVIANDATTYAVYHGRVQVAIYHIETDAPGARPLTAGEVESLRTGKH